MCFYKLLVEVMDFYSYSIYYASQLFGLSGDVYASLRTSGLSAAELDNVILGNVAEMRVVGADATTGAVEVAFASSSSSSSSSLQQEQKKRMQQVSSASPLKAAPVPSSQEEGPAVAFTPVKQTAKAHLPADGVLLKTLKCGTKLQGTVQSCTLYAAFIMANVYREATGGTWKEVNGMLHTSDIIQPHRLLPKRMGLNAAPAAVRAKLGEMTIEPGSKLAVYVKEVFPNSG